jgi:replicative DNA helicase
MSVTARTYQFKEKKATPKIGNVPLPHSTEAEVNVIGAMIMSPAAISKSMDILKVEDFYHQKHQVLFDCICEMKNNAIPLDLLTLKEELKRIDKHEAIGGDLYLLKINRETPSSANIEHHALIVYEYSVKRQAIEIAANLYHNSISPTENIADVIPDVADKIKNILSTNSRVTPDHVATAYNQYLHDIQDGKIKHYPTGIGDLDKLIDGFIPGDFVLIAARPGAGKSAIGVTFAISQCYKFDVPIHFVSIEMSSNELMNRIISQQTGIELRRLKKGQYSDDERALISKRLEKHAKSNFFIDSKISDIDEIVQNIRLRVQRNKTKIVYIDNFQNIRTKRKFNSEKEQNSYFSNVLRDLSKELQIVIVSLNQLNRAAATRGKKQPILSDLRDTGDLEQDAKIVMFVDRPDAEFREKFDDGSDSKGLADIIIAKNRDGATGIVRVSYNKELARFHHYNPLADRETW